MLLAAIANAVATKPVVPKPDEWPFNWFDVVVVVMLIIGVFRGRKHGMSEELLPVFQWLLIIVVSGWAYRPLGSLLVNYAPFLSLLACYVICYVVVALVIRVVIMKLKSTAGEKLVGSDIFGRGEYYLGMMAGALRWGCMVIFFMALFHARLITKEELAATEKMQKLNFEDIRFPTYGETQQAVLFQSLTGPFVREHLGLLLIHSTTAEQKSNRPATPTPARRRESVIDEVLGPKK